jgi:hypothetical protein
MARRRLNLSVDDRTDGLSDEALFCRSNGHKWALRALSRKRFNELLDLGLTEKYFYCENGCEGIWRYVYRIEDGSVVEAERRYPTKGYLLPKNSGRLSRAAARVADFARTYKAYA